MKSMLPVLTAIALSACAGAKGSSETYPKTLNLSGFPPEYRQAFALGCDQAAAGNARASVPSIRSSKGMEVQGLLDSFDVCRRNAPKGNNVP